MAIKTFTSGEVLTAADTNTYLANAGLVLVKSQTIGNAVSTVTVSSCFNSTYDAYRVVVVGGTGSTTDGIAVGMSGGPGSGYYYGLVYATYASTAVNANVNTNNGANWQFVGGTTAGQSSSFVFDLFNPFLSRYTTIHNGSYAGGLTAGTGNGYLAATTSFTGLVIAPQSGTLTGGTITIYGYRKG
jgi:hypothetical protein